ncbi:hypothetical protein HYT05_04760 [Candidatus Kaiserbacteria bacterium]|nr:hypothetical protein [Candidatus Kaiserbacteria bacterium]
MAYLMNWVDGHPIFAPLTVLIIVGMVGMFVTIKCLFTRPVPKTRILDERPWKDPHEEQ